MAENTEPTTTEDEVEAHVGETEVVEESGELICGIYDPKANN
ncbi:hypothetical protein [Streptomyces sp. NPDC086787]